jgi:hypothetical protein
MAADWEPWRPLTLAEQHVDFPGHLEHILSARSRTEQAALPAARRLAQAMVDLGGHNAPALEARVAQALTRELDLTARFGYREARRELAQLRAHELSTFPEESLSWIQRRIALRARTTVANVALAVANRIHATTSTLRTDLVLAAIDTAQRSLHNGVLELVGETLNWGRLAGVTSLTRPPNFAMRSELLDSATCSACNTLDGAILEVGSPTMLLYLPPAGCFGGGRCRGVVIFADRISDVRGIDTDPGVQPALPPIPPVQFPRRKAA